MCKGKSQKFGDLGDFSTSTHSFSITFLRGERTDLMQNISMFELLYPTFKIDKPVRLIEWFAGVGSQAMALRNHRLTKMCHFRG